LMIGRIQIGNGKVSLMNEVVIAKYDTRNTRQEDRVTKVRLKVFNGTLTNMR
jgi:hypothetical protein